MSWRYPWAWGPENRGDWDLSLNAQIPLALTIQTASGLANLDFSELRLTDLRIQTSNSFVTLSLPAHAGETKSRIEGSNSMFEIHIPPGVAAQIRSTNTSSGLEVDANRFVILEDGREYRSLDYETAANRVDIELEHAAGAVKIK
jgi:hypothetical protein